MRMFGVKLRWLILPVMLLIGGSGLVTGVRAQEQCAFITNQTPACAWQALIFYETYGSYPKALLSACERLYPDHPIVPLIRAFVLFRISEYGHTVSDTEIARSLELVWEKMKRFRTHSVYLLMLHTAYEGVRALWLYNRGKSYSAGRAAKRMYRYMNELPREIRTCPLFRYFHGTYQYFADTIPGYLKVLRYLLGIPGGDRVKGLAHLEYAGRHPSPLQIEAIRTLTYIELFFERDYESAIAWGSFLVMKTPLNPTHRLFLFRAYLHGNYFEEAFRVARNTLQTFFVFPHSLPERTLTEFALWYGRLFMHHKNWAIARNWFEWLKRTKKEKPPWLTTWEKLSWAELYDHTGDIPRALRMYRALLKGPDVNGVHHIVRHRFKTGKPYDLNWSNY